VDLARELRSCSIVARFTMTQGPQPLMRGDDERLCVESPLGMPRWRRPMQHVLQDDDQLLRHFKVALVASEVERNQHMVRQSPVAARPGFLIRGGIAHLAPLGPLPPVPHCLASPEGFARPGDRCVDQQPGIVVECAGDYGEVPVKVGVPVEPGCGQGAAGWRGGLHGFADQGVVSGTCPDASSTTARRGIRHSSGWTCNGQLTSNVRHARRR
jgi:hypothetical protein